MPSSPAEVRVYSATFDSLCRAPALSGTRGSRKRVLRLAVTLQCGFPSPAQDYAQKRLDLNDLLVKQPDATFFMRVRGDSMRDAGIQDGDYVIVDRSVTPAHGRIVVAVVDGEYTVKRLYKRKGLVRLDCANPTFANIELKDGQELYVWGVVTWTFRPHTSSVSP